MPIERIKAYRKMGSAEPKRENRPYTGRGKPMQGHTVASRRLNGWGEAKPSRRWNGKSSHRVRTICTSCRIGAMATVTISAPTKAAKATRATSDPFPAVNRARRSILTIVTALLEPMTWLRAARRSLT